MKENEYQCAACGGIFEKGSTEEEVIKECEDKFGKKPNEEEAKGYIEKAKRELELCDFYKEKGFFSRY